jgi:type VI secretion system protein ImpC
MFNFNSLESNSGERRDPESPFRCLVMGDFRGLGLAPAPQDLAGIMEYKPRPVDIDNIDAVLAELHPKLQLNLPEMIATPVELEFSSLDNFHPDLLCRQLPILQQLLGLKQRLGDPRTFREAADELRRLLSLPHEATEKAAVPAPEDDSDTLNRLLGATPPQRTPAANAVQDLIRHAVAPHAVPAADASQSAYVQMLDGLAANYLRALLHHPAFQTLEAAWRALYWLVSNTETDENLQIYLLDASAETLAADFAAANAELRDSRFYRLLADQGASRLGGQAWSLIIGNFAFGPDAASINLLAALGASSAANGAAFIAAAKPGLLGCEKPNDLAEPGTWKTPGQGAPDWMNLRRSAVAPWIGLTVPRFLLRLPYGKNGEATEHFGFEEITHPASHEAYVWGNGAFACAHLLASAFREAGWEMQTDDYLEVGDLPAYTYKTEDGETLLQAVAELYLPERAIQALLDAGVMPLISHQRASVARLARFQSIADPPQTLAGP